MVRGKVLDDDETDTRLGRHVPEEVLEGFQAARRSPERRNDEFGIALAHFLPSWL